METMKRRRTIRKYAKRDIPETLLQELLSASLRTQTMGNLQLYSVVVTREEEMKRRLSPAHFGQPMVTEAPVVLTICADFRRTSLWCKSRGAEPGYDNFLSFLSAATDALLFTQTFSHLAEEAGLGICFLGTTVYQPQAIIDTLKLPHLVVPVATLCVGWPDEEPPLSDRLPLDAIVHLETYTDYTPDTIDAFYEEKEALKENQSFVEENHVPSLAHIFTDIRYTRKDNEAMSEGMLRVLRAQGFLK